MPLPAILSSEFRTGSATHLLTLAACIALILYLWATSVLKNSWSPAGRP